ncbi:hypothetical protein MMC13_001110 [Lambiella insularis]|nr:hypothetical protein [Lambiella insularis]
MPPREIIDLCLSTDDEQPPRLPAPQANAVTTFSTAGFVDLSDEFDFPFDLPSGKPQTGKSSKPISAPKLHRTAVEKAAEPNKTDFHLPVPKRRKLSKAKDDSDPILFTSSPYVLPTRAVLERSKSCPSPVDNCDEENDDSDELDDISDILAVKSALTSHLSSRTTALLSVISGNVKKPRKREESGPKTKIKEGKVSNKKAGEIIGGRSGSTAPSSVQLNTTEKTSKPRKAPLNSAEREAREQEKEQVRLRKETEKEDEKERKRLAKEEKTREKEVAAVLAEVNKSKVDKKTSTPEMIVDLPASIRNSTVDTQIREFLRVLNVETTTKENPVPNVIRWRRKAKSRFNSDLGHWEPMAETILPEKHIMCLVSAREFVALATARGPDNEDLEGHVQKLKNAFPGCVPIYMIEGLDAWSRKVRNSKNRAYQAAVLHQMENGGEPSARNAKPSKSKQKQPEDELVDGDRAEDSLLRLQVMQGCMVHQTNASVETAEWVASFTQHISTIPYKKRKANLDASFCMDVGQVKTGEDKDDTFIKMLQEIIRVTAPVACGIAAEYPNVVSLLRGFKQHGPLVLEDLKKSANRNGALTEARIGPALSKRLYKVFMSTDPTLMDI